MWKKKSLNWISHKITQNIKFWLFEPNEHKASSINVCFKKGRESEVVYLVKQSPHTSNVPLATRCHQWPDKDKFSQNSSFWSFVCLHITSVLTLINFFFCTLPAGVRLLHSRLGAHAGQSRRRLVQRRAAKNPSYTRKSSLVLGCGLGF